MLQRMQRNLPRPSFVQQSDHIPGVRELVHVETPFEQPSTWISLDRRRSTRSDVMYDADDEDRTFLEKFNQKLAFQEEVLFSFAPKT